MYNFGMRTTLNLDDDVLKAVEDLRRAESIGMSEAVNQMLRRSLVGPEARTRYRHRSAPLGCKVDVANIGEVLDLLDEPRQP